MPKPPKLKKKIPVLTNVISKGNRAKEYRTAAKNIAPATNNEDRGYLIDRSELEALVKPFIEKKLSVYAKLLSAELTRDIVNKLDAHLQNKHDKTEQNNTQQTEESCD